MDTLKLFMAIPGKVNFLQMPTGFANLDLSRCEEIEVDKGRLFGLQPDSQVIDKLFKELVLFTARVAKDLENELLLNIISKYFASPSHR